VPQNALDHRIIHAKAIQIRRQAPAEPMPSMPRDPGTLEHVFHFPLMASVQVERVSDCVREATPIWPVFNAAVQLNKILLMAFRALGRPYPPKIADPLGDFVIKMVRGDAGKHQP
jgi:hypothetical protein